MYSPTQGRFVTMDPIGFQAGDVNLYRFVGNDPTNMVDPSGLEGSPASGYYASTGEKLAAEFEFGAGKALKAKELADLALTTTQKKFPNATLHNDKADAWRHCFWSAMMAKDPALQPGYAVERPMNPLFDSGCKQTYTDFAYKVGYNHELYGDKAGQPMIEHAMDMHNNNVGLNIGRKLGPKATTDDVIAACDKALKDGELIWIVDKKLTKPAVYLEMGKYEEKLLGLDLYLRPTYKQVTTDLTGKGEKTGEPFAPNKVDPFK